MDPSIQPRVIATFPSNGSTGPFELFEPGANSGKPYFVIQFNKLINTDPLLRQPSPITMQGFSRPVMVFPYQNYWWPDRVSVVANGPYSDVLAFYVVDSVSYGRPFYKLGRTYSVTVDTGLEDINSNHLGRPFRFSMTPEPYFRATAFNPQDGSTVIDRQTWPAITFNSPVDTGILHSVRIAPAVEGHWQVNPSDSSFVTFRHLEPLDYNTTYTLSAGADASDAAGNIIHAAAASSFTTTAFKVAWIHPQDGSSGVGLASGTISIGFSGRIDTASARRAFGLTPNTPGHVTASPDGLGFTSISDLAPNTRYTITLAASLSSIEGAHLTAPYSFSFVTDRFRVSYTSPPDGAINVVRSSTFSVLFNGRIDTASVRAAFHIMPDVALAFSIGDQNYQFYPTSQFAASTTYTVTIDSSMRSVAGHTMGVPYAFSFRTGE